MTTEVTIDPYGYPRAGAYDDIQYTPRLDLAMPGYLNLALVEQLNNNMVTLDRAVLADETGAVGGITLTDPVLISPQIGDFTDAPHDHLDADDGGVLSGDAIQTAITGTGLVVKQTGPAITAPRLYDPVADRLAVDNDLSGPRRIDWRTLASQRWSLQAAGGTEPGGDAGSDLNLIYYTDAGALKGTALSVRRTDGRASFPHDVAISGGLTVAGAVSMPGLDVGGQVATGIAAHEAKPDPHPVYATDVALASAITAHEALANPHDVYLTQAEATPLFLPASWGPQHLADTDPHPTYVSQLEGDAAYLKLTGGTVLGVLTVGGPAVPADLRLTGADLSNRLIKWQTNGADRWRMGVIDAQAEGTPDTGSDWKLQGIWNNGTVRDVLVVDRDVNTARFVYELGVGSSASVRGNSTSDALGGAWFSNNTRFANFDYARYAGPASRIVLSNTGSIYFQTAPNVAVAGGMQTFSQRLDMDNAGTFTFFGPLQPTATNTLDLGSSALRWRKVWAVDADFANAPTVGGAPIGVTNPLTLGDGAAPGELRLTGADLSNRVITWQTAGANRFRMGIVDTQPEGVPDVGGDFRIQYWWNTGGPYNVFSIDRDLGSPKFWLFSNPGLELVSTGATIVLQSRANGETTPGFYITGAGQLHWGPGGTTAADVWMGRNSARELIFKADLSPVFSNQNDLGSTGLYWRKLYVIDAEITNPPTIGGQSMDARFVNTNGDVMTGGLTVQADLVTTANLYTPSIYFNGTAGLPTAMRYLAGPLMRWEVGRNGGAETGSNAGSDFYINRYSDAGAFIGTALFVTRTNGSAAFEAALSVGEQLWVGSRINAGRDVVSTGGYAGFVHEDRLTGGGHPTWTMYAAGGYWGLNSSVGGDRLTVSPAGAVTVNGNLATQAITTSGAGAGVNFNDRDGSGAWVVYNQADILRFFLAGVGDQVWFNPNGSIVSAGKAIGVSAAAGQGLTWNADGFYVPAGGGGGLDVNTGDARYVNQSGDQMSGTLHVFADSSAFHSATSTGIALTIQPVDDANPGNTLLGVTNAGFTQWNWHVKKDGGMLVQGVTEFFNSVHFWQTPFIRGEVARVMSIDGPLRLNTNVGDLIFERAGGRVGGFRATDNWFDVFAGAEAPRLRVSGSASTDRILQFYTGATPRWDIGANASAETGSNAGSQFAIRRYSDAGAYLDTPLYFDRANGDATFQGNMSVASLSVREFMYAHKGAAVGINGTAGGINFVTDAGVWQWYIGLPGAAGAKDFTIFDQTGGARLTINETTGESVFNGSVQVVGGAQIWGNVYAYGGTVQSTDLWLTSDPGNTRSVWFRSASVERWRFFTDSVAETGSNAGSDLHIRRYSDAGADLGAVLDINRATGNASFSSFVSMNEGMFAWGISQIRAKVSGQECLRIVPYDDSAPGSPLFGVTNAASSAWKWQVYAGGTTIQADQCLPAVDGTIPLGASYLRWGKLWVKDVDASGALTVSGGVSTTGTINAPSINVIGPAGTDRQLTFYSQGVGPRWYFGVGGDAETGSNAGSNLYILNYGDAGAYLGAALVITRATGRATFGGAVSAVSYFDAPAFYIDPTGADTAQYNFAVSGNNLVLSETNVANRLTIAMTTGAATFGGSVITGGPMLVNGVDTITLNGAGQSAVIFQETAVTRWHWRSYLGDLYLQRYNASGVFQENLATFANTTRLTTIGGAGLTTTGPFTATNGAAVTGSVAVTGNVTLAEGNYGYRHGANNYGTMIYAKFGYGGDGNNPRMQFGCNAWFPQFAGGTRPAPVKDVSGLASGVIFVEANGSGGGTDGQVPLVDFIYQDGGWTTGYWTPFKVGSRGAMELSAGSASDGLITLTPRITTGNFRASASFVGLNASELHLNTLSPGGGATDYTNLLFGRQGSIYWRIGQNVAGANADNFDIYCGALTQNVASFSRASGTLSLTPPSGQYALRVPNSGWGVRLETLDPRQLEFSHSGYTDVTLRNYQGDLWFYPNNIDPARAMVFGKNGSLSLKPTSGLGLEVNGTARFGGAQPWGGYAVLQVTNAPGMDVLATGYSRFGIECNPQANVAAGNTGIDFFGYKGAIGGTNAGTISNLYAMALFGPDTSNTGTISNAAALYVTNPTLGGTVTQNRAIIHGNTGASLTTAGAWTNAPSWRSTKNDIRYLERADVAHLAGWFTEGWRPARYRHKEAEAGDYESFFAVLDDMPQDVREAICADATGGISTKDTDGFLAALLQHALREIAALKAQIGAAA